VDGRTDVRTDVPTYGYFPPLMLLGRLTRVDLISSHIYKLAYNSESDSVSFHGKEAALYRHIIVSHLEK